jgi:hypothetical protein
LTLVGSGCAWIARVTRAPAIRGDAEQSALLIVDSRIVTSFHDRGALETLVGSDDLADVTGGIVSGAGDRKVQGVSWRGILLFEGLAPDTYVLRRIVGRRTLTEDDAKTLYGCPDPPWTQCPRWIDLEYLIHTDDQPRLTLDLGAGGVAYLGRLTFNENHEPPFNGSNLGGTPGGDFHEHHNPRSVLSIEVSRKNETEVLGKLLSNREENAWTERIRARLAELARTSEVGAAPDSG